MKKSGKFVILRLLNVCRLNRWKESSSVVLNLQTLCRNGGIVHQWWLENLNIFFKKLFSYFSLISHWFKTKFYNINWQNPRTYPNWLNSHKKCFPVKTLPISIDKSFSNAKRTKFPFFRLFSSHSWTARRCFKLFRVIERCQNKLKVAKKAIKLLKDVAGHSKGKFTAAQKGKVWEICHQTQVVSSAISVSEKLSSLI